MRMIQLETKRLVLRKFCMDDIEEAYNNYLSDPLVTTYFAFEADQTIQQSARQIQQVLAAYQTNSTYCWAIQLKTGELIGTIQCDIHYPLLNIGEIGYQIGSKWWKKGYTTEAVKAVISYLLKEEKLYLIEAKVNTDNIGSMRVLEKAGMEKEAVLKHRRIDKKTGERRDLAIYLITKKG